MNKQRPLIGITMGDAAGIGPEIIAAVWPSEQLHEFCRPVVYGDPEVLRRAVRLRGVAVDVATVSDVREALPAPNLMPCLLCVDKVVRDVLPGTVDSRAGRAAYQAIVAATDDALAGRIAGLVTAPISKKALHEAGYLYPGHTELLAERCRARQFGMLLFLPRDQRSGVAVVHVTLHVALRKVFELITTEAVVEKIRLVDGFVKQMFGRHGTVAVCALNPHAGENGLFGDEEQRVIEPAVVKVQSEGIKAVGPLPADTAIMRAWNGEFSGVVAMYHDQGHIALKLLGMHKAVNVTLGLPIVRTSVAHGTAFDIAWQGVADPAGLLEAIRVAVTLSQSRYRS